MTQDDSTEFLTVDSISGWYNTLKAANHCFIAYSGGLDSHVLLHLAVTLLPPDKVTALHINHQLSPSSNHWAEHCRRVCAALKIPITVETVTVTNEGEGMEAAARKARYASFLKHLKVGDVLMQAHHADDQVETLLYRLIRGSGVKGMSGIPQTRTLGQGQLLRPLLPFSRAQIEIYARQHALHWIEDESNQNNRFDRNFLRNELIPLVAKRWPDYRQRICLSAGLASRSAELDRICAEQDISGLGCRKERTGWSLEIPALLALSDIRQGNVIRHWIQSNRLPVPGHKTLDSLFAEFLTAKEDAKPLLSWPGAEFRRYRNRLYLMSPLRDTGNFAETLTFDPDKPLSLPCSGLLQAVQVIGEGMRVEPGSKLQVRFRQGGERCEPAGRGHSNTLKKLLQEYNLEPWLRDRTPLIFLDDKLAAAGDLWVCEGFQATGSQQGLRFKITY